MSLFSQWQRITSFSTQSVQKIIFTGNILYLITLNNGVYKSIDGTATWTQINSGLNVSDALRGADIIFSGTNLFAATVDGIYKSTSSGADWVKKSSGILIAGGANNIFAESIFENAAVLYTGTYSGIYRSTNGGENWVVTNISGSAISAKSFINYNGTLFAAREVGNVPGSYKSTDNGLTWQPFSISNTYLPAITFFDDNSRLYAGTIFGVYVSTNNGLNWASRNQGLTADPYSSSLIRLNGILITALKFGGSGIYSSINDGQQWVNAGTGLPFLNEISQLLPFQDKVLAGTSGGIYQRFINQLVPVLNNNEAASEFSLSQNYPNPFNPTTIVNYSIPKDGFVNLRVFDVNGREVFVLVNENQKTGSHEITFDAFNLSSGIYFYKLETNGYSDIKKMIVLK